MSMITSSIVSTDRMAAPLYTPVCIFETTHAIKSELNVASTFQAEELVVTPVARHLPHPCYGCKPKRDGVR